tara:strand:- start:160 stop:429 length:270 start_codon:yes stop_codon:yes gene_type:complete
MTNVTPALSEEMEKLLDRTLNDFMSTLVNLSGSQMDISVGTLIKIPMDAGYVKLFKSADSLKMSLWISNELLTDKLLNEKMNQTLNPEN